MANSVTLPTIGVLALVGAGLGIHLGNASIAEISPHYFSAPQTRFHADLSPNRSGTTDAYEIREDVADARLLGSGCVGCRDFPEEYFPVHDPAVDTPQSSGAEPQVELRPASLEERPSDSLALRQVGLDKIQSYAAFAVSSEEATARASAAEEASADQGGQAPAAD